MIGRRLQHKKTKKVYEVLAFHWKETDNWIAWHALCCDIEGEMLVITQTEMDKYRVMRP